MTVTIEEREQIAPQTKILVLEFNKNKKSHAIRGYKNVYMMSVPSQIFRYSIARKLTVPPRIFLREVGDAIHCSERVYVNHLSWKIP